MANTLERLKAKAESSTFDKVRMPSIKSISKLLTELGIKHSFSGSTNVVEHRSAGKRYVNSRHDGKEGYKLVIDNITEEEGKHTHCRHLELNTSDSYYSWNSGGYARDLVALIEFRESQKKKSEKAWITFVGEGWQKVWKPIKVNGKQILFHEISTKVIAKQQFPKEKWGIACTSQKKECNAQQDNL